jgi:hypothetical protein
MKIGSGISLNRDEAQFRFRNSQAKHRGDLKIGWPEGEKGHHQSGHLHIKTNGFSSCGGKHRGFETLPCSPIGRLTRRRGPHRQAAPIEEGFDSRTAKS